MYSDSPMTPEPTRPSEPIRPSGPIRPARQVSAAAQTPVRRVLRAATHPAILVLAVAGVVSMLSDTRTVDGLALVVMAVVLVWDTARGGERTPEGAPGNGRTPVGVEAATPRKRWANRTPTWLAVVAGGGLAVLVGGVERYSWPATVCVWALASLAIAITWAGPGAETEPLPRAGAWVWAGWAVLVALWELAALLGQPNLLTGSSSRPTISVLLDPALATYPGRVALFGAWLAAGWWLCRRAAQ